MSVTEPTTARKLVADQIADDNPDYRVDEYPNEPSQVRKGGVYVDVFNTRIVFDGTGASLRHEFEVDVYIGLSQGAVAEDNAEDARDNVLLSLQRLLPATVEAAERVVFNEAYIGYRITGWLTSINEFASIVRTEP